MCIELVRFAIEFVMFVAEAVGIVLHQNSAPQLTYTGFGTPNIPYVAFLP